MIELEWDDVDEQLNHVHTQTFYPFHFLQLLEIRRELPPFSIFSLLGLDLGDKKSLISRKEKRRVVRLESMASW